MSCSLSFKFYRACSVSECDISCSLSFQPCMTRKVILHSRPVLSQNANGFATSFTGRQYSKIYSIETCKCTIVSTAQSSANTTPSQEQRIHRHDAKMHELSFARQPHQGGSYWNSIPGSIDPRTKAASPPPQQQQRESIVAECSLHHHVLHRLCWLRCL